MFDPENSSLSHQSTIYDMLMEQVKLENMIYECSDAQLEEIKKIIPKMYKPWVQKLILYASNSHPLSFKYYSELFKLTGEAQIKLSKWNVFSHYLYVSEIIQYEYFDEGGRPNIMQLKRPSLYTDLIKEDSVWKYIQNDDIDKFTNYIAENNITLYETDDEDDDLFEGDIDDIKKDVGKVDDLQIHFNTYNMIEFASFCDSINIVKYLVNEDVSITNYAIVNSIRGGSQNVISYYVSKGVSFDNMLTYAIDSHQNSIAKWLFKKYSDNQFHLTSCVSSFNTEMLLFFLENQYYDINYIDGFNKNCLHNAISNSDICLAEYLMQKGITTSLSDFFNKTPFDYAENEEVRQLHQSINKNVKYLIKEAETMKSNMSLQNLSQLLYA